MSKIVDTISTRLLTDYSVDSELSITFDMQPRYKASYAKYYDLALLCMPSEKRNVLPAELLWADDEECLPLKSADFLAGLARRDHNGEIEGLEEIIQAINLIPGSGEPLEADYFQRIVNSPDFEVEPDALADWERRWANPFKSRSS